MHQHENDIKSGNINIYNLSNGTYMFELICSENYIRKNHEKIYYHLYIPFY